MKYILAFMLVTYILGKLNEENPCVSKTVPSSASECFSRVPKIGVHTCCYIYGTYKDSEGKMQNGATCIEAVKQDVSTGKKKSETQTKIEQGKYLELGPITDIDSFLCFSDISECEHYQPAENVEQCFNAHAELNSEGCCYIETDWEFEGHYTGNIYGNCIDISLKDSETKEKIEITKKMILNGTYWPGVKGNGKVIKQLVCANTKSSKMIKLSFWILALFSIVLF